MDRFRNFGTRARNVFNALREPGGVGTRVRRAASAARGSSSNS